MTSDFLRGLLVGLVVFGSAASGMQCFRVEPAHAGDDTELVLREMRRQTAALERIARAAEKCR